MPLTSSALHDSPEECIEGGEAGDDIKKGGPSSLKTHGSVKNKKEKTDHHSADTMAGQNPPPIHPLSPNCFFRLKILPVIVACLPLRI